MKVETEKLIEILKDNYNLNTDILKSSVSFDEDSKDDILKIGDVEYKIYSGMSDEDINNLAYFINSNTSKDNISESINVDSIYSYEYDGQDDVDFDDYESVTYDSILHEISNLGLLCKVLDVINLPDNDNFVEVTFDIPENYEKNIPDYVKDTTFIIPVERLQQTELQDRIDESLDTESGDFDINQALLIAINSEKEAVTTYEMLLNIVKDSEQRDLLNKIYDDEKEHISLLTGLQSSLMANYVSEDNKEQLDTYAQDIIDTESAE